MAEYIEREAIIKHIEEKLDKLTDMPEMGARITAMESAYNSTLNYIMQIPAVEVEPVKHGKWTSNGDDWECYKCSICRNEAYWDTDYGQQLFDFCPWCGAKMDGKEVQE